MKRKIQRIIATTILAITVLGLIGCSADQDDELSLRGAWVEESPVEERTEIFFHSSTQVTVTKEGGISDDYTYNIVENSIVLNPEAEGETEDTELFFRQLDENSIQLENLYVSIPEDEPTYMIFRRKNSGD